MMSISDYFLGLPRAYYIRTIWYRAVPGSGTGGDRRGQGVDPGLTQGAGGRGQGVDPGLTQGAGGREHGVDPGSILSQGAGCQ